MRSAARWRFEAAGAAVRLRAAGDELETLLRSRGVSSRARYGARLVTEELVLNAFEHGGAEWVTLEAGSEDDPLRMDFEDNGADFDVALSPAPADCSDPADVKPRGRGLVFVHAAARDIEHSREAGRNRLRVLLAE